MDLSSNKKLALESFLRLIDQISNEEYQRRIWIRMVGPEWSNHTEMTCQFFDNYAWAIEYYKNYGISEKQHKALLDLYKKYEAFNHNNPGAEDDEVIDHPEWQEVREAAAKVIKAFRYKRKPSLFEQQKGQIIANLLQHVDHLSDIDYQKATWTHKKDPNADSFAKARASFLEIATPMFKWPEYYKFSKTKFKAFLDFYNAIICFDPQGQDEAIFINPPQWRKITLLGKKLLKAFHYQQHPSFFHLLKNKLIAYIHHPKK